MLAAEHHHAPDPCVRRWELDEGGRRQVIRSIVTFIVVSFVLLALAGVIGWLGPVEVVIVLALGLAIAIAVDRMRKRKTHTM